MELAPELTSLYRFLAHMSLPRAYHDPDLLGCMCYGRTVEKMDLERSLIFDLDDLPPEFFRGSPGDSNEIRDAKAFKAALIEATPALQELETCLRKRRTLQLAQSDAEGGPQRTVFESLPVGETGGVRKISEAYDFIVLPKGRADSQ